MGEVARRSRDGEGYEYSVFTSQSASLTAPLRGEPRKSALVREPPSSEGASLLNTNLHLIKSKTDVFFFISIRRKHLFYAFRDFLQFLLCYLIISPIICPPSIALSLTLANLCDMLSSERARTVI